MTCALICFFLTESLYRKLYIPFDAARFTLHGFAVESYKQIREGRFLCLCVHVRMWCEPIDYLRPSSLSRESLPTPCMARSCEAELLLRVEEFRTWLGRGRARWSCRWRVRAHQTLVGWGSTRQNLPRVLLRKGGDLQVIRILDQQFLGIPNILILIPDKSRFDTNALILIPASLQVPSPDRHGIYQ